MDVDTKFELKDFSKDVIESSQDRPVLVDFWAEWCGPCKFLGPIVEKLANESADKWKLVKVNTEQHQEVALEWGIKGIPNLKLFYKGEVIDEVSGAMPEADLRKWLEEKLPSKAKALAMEAAKLIETGEIDLGVTRLEEALVEDESLTQAKLMLAKQKLWVAPEEALVLLEDIKYLEPAKELLLMTEAISMSKTDLKASISRSSILDGISALKKQDMASSIESLIQAITLDKPYHEEFARKLAIALFHYLGETNEITRAYRRKFDMALY